MSAPISIGIDQAGYSQIGGWNAFGPGRKYAPSADSTASYSFDGAGPGRWRIFASWPGFQASATSYTIFDGLGPLETQNIPQTAAPTGGPEIVPGEPSQQVADVIVRSGHLTVTIRPATGASYGWASWMQAQAIAPPTPPPTVGNIARPIRMIPRRSHRAFRPPSEKSYPALEISALGGQSREAASRVSQGRGRGGRATPRPIRPDVAAAATSRRVRRLGVVLGRSSGRSRARPGDHPGPRPNRDNRVNTGTTTESPRRPKPTAPGPEAAGRGLRHRNRPVWSSREPVSTLPRPIFRRPG